MMYQIPLLKMQLNDIRRKYFKPINPNNNSGCNNNGNYYQYSNTIEAGTFRFKFICTYHYKHLLICLIKFTLITRDPSTFKKSTSNAQSVIINFHSTSSQSISSSFTIPLRPFLLSPLYLTYVIVLIFFTIRLVLT